jgi:surfactin family lipopeptide synthetase A
MVPSVLVHLTNLPFTINGKLDQRSLPKPELVATVEYIAPVTKQEQLVCEVFAEVLGLERVGMNDDFFRLGGNSIKVITLVNKLRQVFDLKVADIFKLRTANKIAALSQRDEEQIKIAIIKQDVRDYYPLSTAQERIYIAHKFAGANSILYNIPCRIELTGNLDRIKLGEALDELFVRHSILRARFIELADNQVVQIIADDLKLTKEYAIVSPSEVEAIFAEFVRPFDFAEDVLFRVKLLKLSSKRHILLLDFPHIIVDGGSLGALLSDLQALYNNQTLEDLKIQYTDFAIWQREFLEKELLLKQKNYWNKLFKNHSLEPLNLPLDYVRPVYPDYQGDNVILTIDNILTTKLNAVSLKHNVSLYSLCLLGFNLLLHIYTEQDNLTIGGTLSGRNYDEVVNIIGMFVNTLPLVAKIENNPDCLNLLNDIQNTVLGILDNQDYPIEQIIRDLNVVGENGRNPLFDVMFNYLEQEPSLLINELNWNYKDNEDGKIAKSDLGLEIINQTDKLVLIFNYATSLFKANTISRMSQHYVNILQQLADNLSSDLHVSDINILASLGEEAIDDQLLEFPYQDFKIWQNDYLTRVKSKQQLKYWKTKLSGYTNLNLVTDKPRPQQLDYCSTTYKFSLEVNDLNKQLRKFADSHGFSLYGILLAGFNLALRVFSNQDDILVGTPVLIKSGSLSDEISDNIVNHLVLRSEINLDLSLINYIREVENNIIEAKLNQDILFEELIDELGVAQDSSRHPIFQVMFGLENYVSTNLNMMLKTDRFDLSMMLDDSREEILGSLNYATSLYHETTVSQIVNSYLHILQQLVGQSEQQIKQLSYLSPESYKQIVYDWNNTAKEYPADKTIHQLFEEQVIKTPDNIAVVYGDNKLTYAQLNAKANQLANYLRETYQIQGDDLIVLCLERSELILIAILAVLKSGGGYVPLDPSYPADRISYVLSDTKAKVLIANEINQDKLVEIINAIEVSDYVNRPQLEVLDSQELDNMLADYSFNNPNLNANSNNLCYVIYTSGTTGKPKGVMLEHRNVTNEILAQLNIIEIEPTDRLLLTANYVFDASVENIFMTIYSGACLHIIDEKNLLDLSFCEAYIHANKINILNSTPSYISTYSKDILKLMKCLILGGEAYQNLGVDVDFYNTYGPTEATIVSTVAVNDTHIGKPIANTTVYIVDNQLKPLPIGAIGELYIGGVGLARGYLNLPELTAEKFITNPFQTMAEQEQGINARLYKTGDLVRYLPDGNIEYIGRNDFQVKIRGFRIELGEIENQLSKLDQVKQAVVLAVEQQGSSEKYLVGYYVANELLDHEQMLDQLSKVLPEYMVPSVLVHLTNLPLTINGKLDQRSLPKPELVATVEYIAPVTKQEQLICEAFAEILGLERIGMNDDFFRMGGSSIKVIRVVAKLQKNFKIEVSDVFKYKTPELLSKNIKFVKDNLLQQLQEIKKSYLNVSEASLANELVAKNDVYLEEVNNFEFKLAKKAIKTVLLTGATGYLGCNLLNQLLVETDYTVCLIVRAGSIAEAEQRLLQKYHYYFDNELLEYSSRLKIYAGNIEQSNLGLADDVYDNLVSTVDSIIHSAALVKHYGNYEEFYNANVQATINLLDLSKQTKLKDFHYISTYSVLQDGYIPDVETYIATEHDELIELNNRQNVYVKTKYEGELVCLEYRQYGVNTNVYRVGNLSMHSRNYRNQENIEDNGFFSTVKTMLNLGIIAEEVSLSEISPVNYTALSIVRIFEQVNLSNRTYHVYNPNLCNLSKIFLEDSDLNIKLVSISDFIDELQNKLSLSSYRKLIEMFMLHAGWLQEMKQPLTRIQIKQDLTERILKQLDISWPEINVKMLADLIEKSFKERVDFFTYNNTTSNLTKADIVVIAKHCVLQHYNLNSIIDNHKKDTLKFIQNGIIESYVKSQGGWISALQLLASGDIVNLEAISGANNSTGYEAIFDDVTTLELEQSSLLKLFSQIPLLQKNLVKQIFEDKDILQQMYACLK